MYGEVLNKTLASSFAPSGALSQINGIDNFFLVRKVIVTPLRSAAIENERKGFEEIMVRIPTHLCVYTCLRDDRLRSLSAINLPNVHPNTKETSNRSMTIGVFI